MIRRIAAHRPPPDPQSSPSFPRAGRTVKQAFLHFSSGVSSSRCVSFDSILGRFVTVTLLELQIFILSPRWRRLRSLVCGDLIHGSLDLVFSTEYRDLGYESVTCAIANGSLQSIQKKACICRIKVPVPCSMLLSLRYDVSIIFQAEAFRCAYTVHMVRRLNYRAN
ncbi:hypothetical protein BDV19DRAFT_244963 [Aspergillus venezuelensis]